MEFARFEGKSDGGLPTALNLVPAHLVEVSREGDQTMIVMSAGQTHRVSYTEAEVIAEFRRAEAAQYNSIWPTEVMRCTHSAAQHIDGRCAEESCDCMGWPTIARWHAPAESPGA